MSDIEDQLKKAKTLDEVLAIMVQIEEPTITFVCPECKKPFVFKSQPVFEETGKPVGFSIYVECKSCEFELALKNETSFHEGVGIVFGDEQ